MHKPSTKTESTAKAPVPVAILIAAQRTGTHYLRGLLQSHERIEASLEEVFHGAPAAVCRHDNFWNFLLSRCRADADSCLPWRREEMFTAFLDHVVSRHPGKTVLIDIKYNSLHHLNGTWQAAGGEPAALIHFRERRLPVIHLRRRNILKTVVSGLRANAASQHVVLDPSENRTRPLRVDCGTIRHWVDGFRAESDFVTAMLSRNPGVLEVWYEDLWVGSPGGRRNSSVEGTLLAHLGACRT